METLMQGFYGWRLLRLIHILTVIGIVIPLLLMWRLWTTDHVFPMTPLLNSLATIDGSLSFAIYFSGLAALCLSLVSKIRIICLAIYFSIVVFWILQDINRNIIWFYMYNFILLAILLAHLPRKGAAPHFPDGYINNIRAIICGTYMWGGLNKINQYFYEQMFPWFISPLINNIHQYTLGSLFVYSVPFLEFFIGFGLLYGLRHFRWIAIAFAYCMLIVNLVSLGPLGHNWANRVWSWNAIIFLMSFLLFYKQGSEVNFKTILGANTELKWPILFLIFFAPVLWNFGMWPTHNSFMMYEGIRANAEFRIREDLHYRLPSVLQEVIRQRGSHFSIIDWTNLELNTAPQSELTVFNRAAQKICSYTGPTDGVEMLVTPAFRQRFGRKKVVKSLPCLGANPVEQ